MGGVDHWPLFGLSVRTPRLELRYANDELLLALADRGGDVIAPGTRPFDDEASFYDRGPEGRRRWLAGQWAARGRTSPEWWVLVFAVVVDGEAVGTQEITGAQFPELRTVETFSWLARSHQGRGLGREMREAVLHLAFAGLGARLAVSEAFEDNLPSCRVSLAAGYRRDGTVWALRQGEAAPMARFVLDRDVWEQRRRTEIDVDGLESCLPFLGIPALAGQPPPAGPPPTPAS